LFDGTPAPILSAAQNQITVVVPASIAGAASTLVRIEKNGTIGPPLQFPAGETFPALLTLDGSGKGQVQATNPDGTPNGPSAPAPGGSILTLYATGAGVLDQPVPDGQVTARDQAHPAAPIFVRIGKLPAEIVYAGTASQMVNGVIQVDIRLPAELVPGPEIPVQFIAGTYSSQPGATIAVR
jgi:uncharacterized protein (TIGR03437 family)